MIFPFVCKKCNADKWMIEYDAEDKYHTISCVKCGDKKILESIFGSRRARGKLKDVKA